MIVIQAMDKTLRERLVASSLLERLEAMPAVVVTGARQTGKSTLVSELTPGNRRYVSLDDLDVVEVARREPDVLVGGRQPVILMRVVSEPRYCIGAQR